MKLINSDCRDALKALDADSIDSCITDPPYSLVSIQKRFGKVGSAPAKDRDGLYKRASAGFMEQQWDTGETAFDPEFWREVLRVLKPGAYLLAFGGTRTYHRLACAIEDAGFEIRDQIGWCFGTGFPKSHKQSGEWEGWGTALKPAWEPICLARKPLISTVAANMLAHGTGALNINACRIATAEENPSIARRKGAINHLSDRPARDTEAVGKLVSRQSPEAFRADRPGEALGRWPANVIHDGSKEVIAAFPQYESGSAARFFYSAKADADDRGEGNTHPTVKPINLMKYLCQLVMPLKGIVLDPFMGSGSTGVAAIYQKFDFIGIEREAKYFKIAEKRIDEALNPLKRRPAKLSPPKESLSNADWLSSWDRK